MKWLKCLYLHKISTNYMNCTKLTQIFARSYEMPKCTHSYFRNAIQGSDSSFLWQTNFEVKLVSCDIIFNFSIRGLFYLH